MDHYLAQLIIITIIATLLIHIPTWVLALNKKVFKKIDFVLTFIPSVTWLIFTAAGIGSMSMTNIFEIPLVIMFTLLAWVYIYFSHFPSLSSLTSRYTITVFLVLAVILIRIFAPALPN